MGKDRANIVGATPAGHNVGAAPAQSHNFEEKPWLGEKKSGCEEFCSVKPQRWPYVASQLTTFIPVVPIHSITPSLC